MLLIDLYKIPVLFSLCVVASIIAASILLSLKKDAREQVDAALRTDETAERGHDGIGS